jgi:hypothetical protein
MSKFKEIEDLERDRDQNGLYDLFVTTFVNNKAILVYGYTVQRGEEMRIDNICNRIYNNINHLSFVLQLNNIQNPLTIKAGDLLFYVREEDIPSFTADPAEASKFRDRVINNAISDKKKQVDAVRNNYTNNRKSADPLPPNIKESGDSPVTITDGIIKIVIDKDQSLKAKNENIDAP